MWPKLSGARRTTSQGNSDFRQVPMRLRWRSRSEQECGALRVWRSAYSPSFGDVGAADRLSNSSAVVRHGSDGRNVDDVTKQEGEETDEDQTDQRARRRPGKGPALLYRSAGLRKEDRLQPRGISLAHRGLSRGSGWHGTAAGAQRQPGRQSLPAGDVPASPTCSDVLYRRRAGRLRADESARRRFDDVANGCDRLENRETE